MMKSRHSCIGSIQTHQAAHLSSPAEEKLKHDANVLLEVLGVECSKLRGEVICTDAVSGNLAYCIVAEGYMSRMTFTSFEALLKSLMDDVVEIFFEDEDEDEASYGLPWVISYAEKPNDIRNCCKNPYYGAKSIEEMLVRRDLHCSIGHQTGSEARQ